MATQQTKNGMHPAAEREVARRTKSSRSDWVRAPRGVDHRQNPARKGTRKAASSTS